MSFDMKRLEHLMVTMRSLGIQELAYEGNGEALRLVSAPQNNEIVAVFKAADGVNSDEDKSEAPVSHKILASMHGVFYRSEAPKEPPLVEVGNVVKAGDALCLVEAMKMLSKIEAEYSCRVTRVLKQDGDVIEPNMALFEVELVDA